MTRVNRAARDDMDACARGKGEIMSQYPSTRRAHRHQGLCIAAAFATVLAMQSAETPRLESAATPTDARETAAKGDISSPAVAEGLVFVGGRTNFLYALNATTGREVGGIEHLRSR